MGKICPKCKRDDFEDFENHCMDCGVKLVDKQANVPFNIGDANAISGGVNINQSKNVTSNDTHYHSTTVMERPKTEGELKLDASNQLRAKAEEIMSERGRLDSVAKRELRSLAVKLGINDEDFKTILKEVLAQGSANKEELNAGNARLLQQAQKAVQANDVDTLCKNMPSLEALANMYQDENVQYLYYLTLSLFNPLRSIELFEQQTDENYWRAFWAIVSYACAGKNAETQHRLVTFIPSRFEKPEVDRFVLDAFVNIMAGNKEVAQECLGEIFDDTSIQIQPFYRAIEVTLYEEEPESLEVRFYAERVMKHTNSAAKEVAKKEKKAEVVVETKPEPVVEEKKQEDNSALAQELYLEASKAKSKKKRVELLQKAAEAGSPEAMYELADAYYDGEGVKEDKPLSVEWMQKAADAGSLQAIVALGLAYYSKNELVEQNADLGERYLKQAAELGSTDAQAFYAQICIDKGDYDKALLWAKKASMLDHPHACFLLGRIYNEGLGVDVDEKESLKWYEKAANAGDAESQNIVGNTYSSNNELVPEDYEKAFKYYQMAASQDHVYGMLNLAAMYLKGIVVDENILTASEWALKAIKIDGIEAEALNMAGNILSNTCDIEEAFNCYAKAAAQGYAYGMYNLAICYQNGGGVEQNIAVAKEWMQKAAEAGVEEAKDELENNTLYNTKKTKSQKKTKETKQSQSNTPIAKIEKVSLSSDGNKRLICDYSINVQNVPDNGCIQVVLHLEPSFNTYIKNQQPLAYDMEGEAYFNVPEYGAGEDFKNGVLKMKSAIYIDMSNGKPMNIDGINVKEAKVKYSLSIIFCMVDNELIPISKDTLLTKSTPKQCNLFYECNIFSKDKLKIK